MIAAVSLNPSIDHYLRVPSLDRDDTVRAISSTRAPAGKGANLTRASLALGAEARVYAFLAGEVGRQYRRLAGAFMLPIRIVDIRGQTRVNLVLQDISKNSEIRISESGPVASSANLKKLSSVILRSAKRISTCVLSGSLPRGLAVSAYAQMVLRLRRGSVKCFLDADGEAFAVGVRARPYGVKPNTHEISRFFGRQLIGFREISEAACELASRGIACVIVSMGENGAVFCLQGQKPIMVQPPRIRVNSRIGAGDVLLAAYLCALEKNKPFVDCAAFAVAAGTASAALPAGVVPTAKDVRAVLRRVRVRSTR